MNFPKFSNSTVFSLPGEYRPMFTSDSMSDASKLVVGDECLLAANTRYTLDLPE